MNSSPEVQSTNPRSQRCGLRPLFVTLCLVIACNTGDQIEKDPGSPLASDAPTPVEGRTVEAGPNCPSCTILISEAGLLGALEDEFPIGDGSFLVALESGKCIVGPTDRDGELLAFERCRGAPTAFGVAGEGPGELGVVRQIARWRGDSVLVFGYGQMAILSGESGNGRTVRFDPGTQGLTIVPLAAGAGLVVNNDHPTKPQFTVIRPDGALGATFGLPATIGRSADARRNRSSLGRSARPESFWAAPSFYDFDIVRWSSAGEEQARFSPRVRWFTPYDSTDLEKFWAVGAAAARPLPMVRAIHEVEDGVLWVAHGVAASDWQPDSVKAPQVRARNGEARGRSSSRPEHFDGMLSAIDASTGEHLVTTQTADVIIGFASDTVAYVRRRDGNGVQQIALLRFGLLR